MSVGLDRAVQKWNLGRRRSAWSRPLELRVAPTRVLAHDGAALTGGADGAVRRVGPGRAAAAGTGLCDGPLTDLEPLPGEADAALAACGDGAVRRLRAAGPGSGDDWSADGEPWRLAHDTAAVLAPAAGGTWYTAGEAVTALAAADGAVRWRVWFTRDGSATAAADDRWGSAGDGARLVWYSDGRTVRTVDDPAVPGRGLDAPPATDD